jgi:cytochrome b561
MLPAAPCRHDTFTIALHWIIAILVIAAFSLGPGGSEQKVYSAAKDFERQVHEVLGLSVLTLTVVRLAWRALARAPAAPPMPRWMSLAGRATHVALYVLLVAVPLTAVAGAWLEGHDLTLGILGNIPPPIAEHHALGKKIAKVHEYLGDTIVWLAGFHAAAGFFHHFFLGDGVLRAMLPFAPAGAKRRVS